MLKLHVSIFFLFFLYLPTAAQDAGIVWEKDFKRAQALAFESGRPLLLDFTAPWCKPCVAMDKQFWVLPEVVEAVKPFIAVKIDYDNQKNLVGKYGVSAIPFVVFADPLGNPVTFRRGFGSKSAKELNQILSEMPKDFSAMKKHYETLAADEDDAAALLAIADFYRESRMLTLSSRFYERALDTPAVKNDREAAERARAWLAVNRYAVGDFKAALEDFEDYLKNHPKGAQRELALSLAALVGVKLDKLKLAEKYLALLAAEFPESKNVAPVTKAFEDAKNKKDE